jgi:hypothetical protein
MSDDQINDNPDVQVDPEETLSSLGLSTTFNLGQSLNPLDSIVESKYVGSNDETKILDRTEPVPQGHRTRSTTRDIASSYSGNTDSILQDELDAIDIVTSRIETAQAQQNFSHEANPLSSSTGPLGQSTVRDKVVRIASEFTPPKRTKSFSINPEKIVSSLRKEKHFLDSKKADEAKMDAILKVLHNSEQELFRMNQSLYSQQKDHENSQRYNMEQFTLLHHKQKSKDKLTTNHTSTNLDYDTREPISNLQHLFTPKPGQYNEQDGGYGYAGAGSPYFGYEGSGKPSNKFNPGSMSHEFMDPKSMNPKFMDPRSMGHESTKFMDRSTKFMDPRSMGHESTKFMDPRSMGHESTKFMDPRSMNHESTNLRSMNHESMNPDHESNKDPFVDHESIYRDYGRGHYNDIDKPINALCKLQSPHNLLTVFQKTSRMKIVSINSHTFRDWMVYTKALLTSCYLGCLIHIPSHLAPLDEEGWRKIEYSYECRASCVHTITQLKNGFLPVAVYGMSIAALTGVFNAVVLAWPSIFLTINSIFENSIDTASLGHLKNPNLVDSYTIRITFYKVIKNFIMSNDNAKTIRLRAFLNKSVYNTSQSPESFAIQLLRDKRDINELYGGLNSDESTNIIGEAMLKETYVEAIRIKTDKLYDNILDNIDDISKISFNTLVTSFNNKYMKQKTRVVTEQLFSVSDVPKDSSMNPSDSMKEDSSNDESIYYSSSNQTPIKKKGKELPCFNMRDDGKCAFGDACKFSHVKSVLLQKVDKGQYVRFLQEQRSLLNDVALYTKGKYTKYKKAYNSLATKRPPTKAPPSDTRTKYFEDVGNKGKKASAYSAIDSAEKADEANDDTNPVIEEEYTSDNEAISDDTSDAE